MKEQIVNPCVGNFIKSLRDIGYNFEIAVADVIDNSITANAKQIKIYAKSNPEISFCIIDDGFGMTEEELMEALRLAGKDPSKERKEYDLGRFGLGLKTASFSQCKKLTVLSKKEKLIHAAQWDLNYLEEKNEWLLKIPNIDELQYREYIDELKEYESGTIVIWEDIDKCDTNSFTEIIDILRKHLSLVFHRYLEGSIRGRKISMYINNSKLEAFDPFNISHPATQELSIEKIKIYGQDVIIQPFILPHHSKVSRQEYERYATEDGYTKSQGFYLYRENRLLIYGTWWGLHRIKDAHKLVRIKIDISNKQDKYWGIDIKKSTANPCHEIKKDLKRIISQSTERGSRTFRGRGKKILDKTVTRFWDLVPNGNNIRFSINNEHPVLNQLKSRLDEEENELLSIYLSGLQSYLPLEAIQAQLLENPHKVKQEEEISDEKLIEIISILKSSGVDESYIEELLKTELFKNKGELLHANS